MYTKPDSKFIYFSALEDLRMVLSKLEERYGLEYINAARQSNGSYQEIVKKQFQEVREKQHKPFYIIPLLYAECHNIIRNLHDPYFRIDKNEECIHIWCKEWAELFASL